MLTKIDKIRWKSELDNWLSCAEGWSTDERGFIHLKRRTKKQLARKMLVSDVTVHRWFKTGTISNQFRRELLRLKIVRKDYV